MPKTRKILITTRSHEIYLVRTMRKEDVTSCPECGHSVKESTPDYATGKFNERADEAYLSEFFTKWREMK